MKFIYVFVIILSIYKSCDWIYFFHGMVFEIVLIMKFKFFLFKFIYIFREKKVFLYIIWKILSLNFNLVIWTKL